VKAIAARCDLVLVIGAPNSSNSLRLVEVAERMGTKARLVQRASDIDWALIDTVKTLGITAGASAPEILVEEVIAAARDRYDVMIENITTTSENVTFKLPRILTEQVA
jgi:4-hydroxy-3-methylbut-2-enyl diphosphate reductase